jgi:hypothetical protein
LEEGLGLGCIQEELVDEEECVEDEECVEEEKDEGLEVGISNELELEKVEVRMNELEVVLDAGAACVVELSTEENATISKAELVGD